ncbi:hypothetical protein P3W24_14100 [Luteibacter sp. PPL201]|jgi:hypothetical protein|uniref:Uncharacterized protein n=1 Tax=Luteibacter sahnii TaxID=3021977 RepID=A0ABT6BDE7_9GAMM|nr:hypothetical protein [Luteibacter sp. PPL193]MDY1549071.1 hypothetical protein [Luteibacter sp. PPL193]
MKTWDEKTGKALEQRGTFADNVKAFTLTVTGGSGRVAWYGAHNDFIDEAVVKQGELLSRHSDHPFKGLRWDASVSFSVDPPFVSGR